MTEKIKKSFSLNESTRERILWSILGTFAFILIYMMLFMPRLFTASTSDGARQVMILTGIVSAFILGYLLLLGILAWHNRPRPALNDAELPHCTVLVPAYNEGEHVSETLTSLLTSDYPADKLQIIAINDGSKDNTWEWICKSAAEANGRIDTINIEKNGGKKHALYIGMKQAKHEIIVTVDSDSVLKTDALRHLVSPFADWRIAAVAGNISAKNLDNGFISQMVDVTLVIGCEFLRAAQGVTGTVFCTPGALSAYRRSAIMPLIDEWLTQTFMGEPARIGEDRAIATLILRSGWNIVHQSSAVAYTCVPTSYVPLCKMLLRWTRSDIRENIMMAGFVLGDPAVWKLRTSAMLVHFIGLSMNLFMPIFFIPVFFYLLFSAVCPPVFLAGNLLLSLLWAAIPAFVYAQRTSRLHAVWAFLFGIFSFFALSWIPAYSFITMRNSKWLTRELPAGKVVTGTNFAK